jgi:hypothetical protein
MCYLAIIWVSCVVNRKAVSSFLCGYCLVIRNHLILLCVSRTAEFFFLEDVV